LNEIEREAQDEKPKKTSRKRVLYVENLGAYALSAHNAGALFFISI